MKLELRAILIPAVIFLSGCISFQQGPRIDPLMNTGLDSAPAFPGLKLAVMLSENSKKTLQITYQGAMFGGYSAREYVDKMFAIYRRNFKSVIQVERIEDARQIGADLVAIIDDYAPKMGLVNREETSVIFLALDGRRIEEIKAAFEKRMGWNTSKDMEAFSIAINGQLEDGMRKSQALIDFARQHPSGGADQPAPAAAVRAYHSDVDRPGYALPEKTDDFALVFGIEKYSALPDADFAERDAQAVRAHLLALGYPERNIVFLKGSQAGKAGIEKYVESWLPRNVKGASRVSVYFSGHGAPDPQTGEAYLIPWDGDPNFLQNTGYPVKRLYEKLSALQAKEVLVAMDACFSGAGGRSVLAKGARPLVTKVETAAVPSNLIVFAAASGDQITSTLDDQGHGIFTYYFLKGLSGAARDAKGRVTTKALYDYLKPKVQDAARRQNRDQEPVLHGSGDRELVRF